MAARNSIKQYLPDSFYHIYNRGVEKRNIFLDEQDYAVFLSYLKTYLLPKDELGLNGIAFSATASSYEKEEARRLLALNNFSSELELHGYALLPNHFHLLLRQTLSDTIDRFINSLGTRYSRYFNKKYRRVGKLFQGVYKAVLVNSDEQLLHLSRYIHLNPFEWAAKPIRNQLQETPFPSSLPEYLNQRNSVWVKTDFLLGYFSKEYPKNDYFKFIKASPDRTFISLVTIDNDD